jgi:two-component system, NtrC family, sensor kinase
MKVFLIFLILIISSCSAFAQEETFKDAERLKQKLSQATTDTVRIILKSRLSEAYRGNNPDTSLLLANQALSKAREIGFKKGEVMALNVLCVLYREKGDLPYALQLGLQGLKIAEKEQLIYEGVYSLIRIANVYLNVGDPTKALPYLHKADKLLEKNYDDFQWGVTQYFMADCYQQLYQLDSAEKKVELLEEKYLAIPIWIVINERLRGNIALKRDEPQQAIMHFHNSLTEAIAENIIRDAATASNSIAEVFKKLNQPDSAIYYAKQGLEFGEILSYTNRILAASSLLAELYAEENPKEAVRYYQMASAAKDSLYGVQKFQRLQSATMEEQERQTEIEAAAIAYRNNLRQRGLIGGVALFLIVAVVLYRNNRQKQKTNKVLEATLSNLKSTQTQLIQSEKMASLGELTAGIAHEIQNPLNFVNNFSEVSNELLEEIAEERNKSQETRDETLVTEILGDIKENLSKITLHGKRADAIVKGMLEHSKRGSDQKELTDINFLAEEFLRLSYQSYLAKDKDFSAELQLNLDPDLPKISVIPHDIGKVLLNLYSNAFYACAERSRSTGNERNRKDLSGFENLTGLTPQVTVSTKNLGDKIVISVSDNGPGIHDSIKDKIFQPFFTTKPTGQGTGLGLSLSYDIVKAHGGEIKVLTKKEVGSEFIIVLLINY